MSIVVTTPTGNIGRALTRALLDVGEKPILIARDAKKVKQFTDAGARVVEGSHSDPAVITEATKGAKALFVLTPPDMKTTDIKALYRRFAEAAAEAITMNDVSHVVHLSSVGADLERGNGPVAGLHVAEGILNRTGKNVTHLRPAYFMENTLGQLPSILQANALYTTFPAGSRFPMIATRDIAARAAEVLRVRDWMGQRVMELQGPGETGYEEVASVLSEVLGRKLAHQSVPAEGMIQALTGMGFSREMAASFVELSDGVTKGLVRFHEPRGAANTTKTTYPVFAQQVFKPIFEATVKR